LKKAVKDVADWLASIDANAKAEKDPHRKAILRNYCTHVALEFNGRWSEFLGPEMAIDDPVYHVRMGTPDVVTADGYNAVVAFYGELNDDTVLTNHDERLAVADWGLASYNTFNMWTRGRRLAALGIKIDNVDPDGYYRIHRPIAMFWNYTSDARLIGEDVFDVHPPIVEKITEAEAPTWEEVRDAVKQYLPVAPKRTKLAA
jgi:hypothetical protein